MQAETTSIKSERPPGRGRRGTSWTNETTLCPRSKTVKSKSQKDGIFLSKQTIDMLLKIPKKHRSDAMALLMFYHYTACWQGTNQPHATTPYVMRGLGWGDDKVKAVRSILRKLGLIEIVRDTDRRTGRVTGHYVRLRYFQPMVNESKVHKAVLPPSGSQLPNAYRSDTTNAYRSGKLNVVREHIEQRYTVVCKLRIGESPSTAKESPHVVQSNNGASPPTHSATPPSPRSPLDQIADEIWRSIGTTP